MAYDPVKASLLDPLPLITLISFWPQHLGLSGCSGQGSSGGLTELPHKALRSVHTTVWGLGISPSRVVYGNGGQSIWVAVPGCQAAGFHDEGGPLPPGIGLPSGHRGGGPGPPSSEQLPSTVPFLFVCVLMSE